MKWHLSVLAGVLFAPAGSMIGATILVDPSGDGDFIEIQAALDAARDGDEVLVRPGEYELSRPVDPNRGFVVGDSDPSELRQLRIRSTDGPAVTVLRGTARADASDEASVVVFRSGEDERTVLEGFTLIGGSGTVVASRRSGGGILCVGSSPRIVECTIAGNVARRGAGIACIDGASPAIDRCHIERNGDAASFSTGGGIYCKNDSSPIVSDSTIEGNVALTGGGLYAVFGSSPHVVRCSLRENRASTGGGMELSEGSSALVLDSDIVGNFASQGGGGLSLLCASPRVENVVIAENRGFPGGGVRSIQSEPTIVRSTVTGNVSDRSGGGLAVFFDRHACAGRFAPLVVDSIVWDNAGGSMHLGRDATAEVRHSSIELADPAAVWPGEGNRNRDPEFCGWGNRARVTVDAAATEAGDGSVSRPFRDLGAALAFDHRTAKSSPLRRAGADGGAIGADRGTCETAGVDHRTVVVRRGEYSLEGVHLAHRASLTGAGSGRTELSGTVFGMRTGAVLEDVSVTAARRGGIRVTDAQSPEIRSCRVVTNVAASRRGGGGMGIYDGASSTVTDVLFEGNRSGTDELPESGGAVECEDAGEVRFSRCQFVANVAFGRGGGVSSERSTVVFDECVFDDNEAVSSGGGLFAQRSAIDVVRSKIVGNRALNSGGGVYAFDEADLRFENALIAGNSVLIPEGEAGAAMHLASARASLEHVTVADNRVLDEQGAALVVEALCYRVVETKNGPEVACPPSTLELGNSTVWGHAVPALGSVGKGSAIEIDHSNVAADSDRPGPGNLAANPRFIRRGEFTDPGTRDDLSDDRWVPGDYRLTSESPLRDAGRTDVDPIVDLDGRAAALRSRRRHRRVRGGETVPCPALFRRGDVDGSGRVDLERRDLDSRATLSRRRTCRLRGRSGHQRQTESSRWPTRSASSRTFFSVVRHPPPRDRFGAGST